MKIFIAGHRGMVGSALVREAQLRGGYEILTAGREELDLLNQVECRAWLEDQKPDQIIIAAAKVGQLHQNLAGKVGWHEAVVAGASRESAFCIFAGALKLPIPGSSSTPELSPNCWNNSSKNSISSSSIQPPLVGVPDTQLIIKPSIIPVSSSTVDRPKKVPIAKSSISWKMMERYLLELS